MHRANTEETEQMGLAQIVIRTQHVAALYPYRVRDRRASVSYASEVRSVLGVRRDDRQRCTQRDLPRRNGFMARQLVASMSTTWDPSEFKRHVSR
jgi:non-homologous end joining protein Ku